MAGRYQGFHSLNTGNIEIFWRADGWCWWSRAPGCPSESAPVGPFLTSTDAYLNANGGACLIPRPARLESPNSRQKIAGSRVEPVSGIRGCDPTGVSCCRSPTLYIRRGWSCTAPSIRDANLRYCLVLAPVCVPRICLHGCSEVDCEICLLMGSRRESLFRALQARAVAEEGEGREDQDEVK